MTDETSDPAIRYELYAPPETERPFLAFTTWSDAARAAMVACRDGHSTVEVYDLQADAVVGRFR